MIKELEVAFLIGMLTSDCCAICKERIKMKLKHIIQLQEKKEKK